MGETQNQSFQLSFNPSLKIDLQGELIAKAEAMDSPVLHRPGFPCCPDPAPLVGGSRVPSDGGLLFGAGIG